MSKVRTRFAPSPTGPLHIGGIRTALFAYLFAKNNNGSFILRIEDTDTARTVENAEDIINKSLEWCGINPDESVKNEGEYSPYKQSLRKNIYSKYAKELIDNGSAYYAFDTTDEIKVWREQTAKQNNGIPLPYNYSSRELMKNSLTMTREEVDKLLYEDKEYVIRYKVNPEDNIEFDDIIRGSVKFHSSQLDDRVLMKSDGMPTYHLANVVDDHLMRISHVIRGEEWLASTPLHILLYNSLGWGIPKFAHLPLILKPEGNGKLSKRDGDRLGFPVFCTEWIDPNSGNPTAGYKEMGFLPEAFINFIAMLGWNDGTDRDIFSMNDLVENFSLDRVQKSGAKFNFEKAVWYNQQYIKNLDSHFLMEHFKVQKPDTDLDDDKIKEYCLIFKDRISYINELSAIGSYLYTDNLIYDTKTWDKKWSVDYIPFIESVNNSLESISIWNSEKVEMTILDIMNGHSLKMGQVMPVLRVLLMGTMKGPSVFKAIEFLGKNKSIERLNNYNNIS